MGINAANTFDSQFGDNIGTFGRQSQSGHNLNRNDRPKAQFWLNVGYVHPSQDESFDAISRFVSRAVFLHKRSSSSKRRNDAAATRADEAAPCSRACSARFNRSAMKLSASNPPPIGTK